MKSKKIKEYMQKNSADGFEYVEASFKDLADLLKLNCAYTPFKFKDGKRNKANLEGKTNWLVLDIDDANITEEEAHLLLSDINHHIARTSNPDNAFKFRILIELNEVIDISELQWKYFLREVMDMLGIKFDLLPKSQIYFAYAGRKVLSVLDGEKLNVKEAITKSAEALVTKETVKSKPNKGKSKELLDNPLDTFSFAFEAKNGEGSRSMIRAAYYAKDLGADTNYILDLIDQINNYWEYSIEQERLENTIKNQIRRW